MAAHASRDGHGDDLAITRLTEAAFGSDGRFLVVHEIEASIVNLELRLLVNGWEPVDLWEIARRRAGTAGTGLLLGLLARAVQRAGHGDELATRQSECVALGSPRHLDSSSSGWPADVAAAVGLIGVLDHLRPLKKLTPADLTAHAASDAERLVLLTRIRRLLAKAESTEFAEEADAYTGKATELMRRHRIDRAAVEAASGVSQLGGMASRRCWIDAPYVGAKCVLLDAVAGANGCRAVCDQLGFVTLVGSPGDIETTELLFMSLLVQATHQMTIAGTTTPEETAAARERAAAGLRLLADGDIEPILGEREIVEVVDRLQSRLAASVTKRKRNPSFRRTFLVAYATRIAKRLTEVNENITVAATAELGSDFLPVLARQQRCVDEAVQKVFGELGFSTVRASDPAGWAAGTAAADLADLNVREELRTG